MRLLGHKSISPGWMIIMYNFVWILFCLVCEIVVFNLILLILPLWIIIGQIAFALLIINVLFLSNEWKELFE